MDENNVFVQKNEEELGVKKSKIKSIMVNNTFNVSIFIASCVAAIVLFIMFFSAANSIKTGGLEIMSIESVGGKTLEEAYYQNLGYVYEGYCVVVKALGVFCSSVLLFFGATRLKNVK